MAIALEGEIVHGDGLPANANDIFSRMAIEGDNFDLARYWDNLFESRETQFGDDNQLKIELRLHWFDAVNCSFFSLAKIKETLLKKFAQKDIDAVVKRCFIVPINLLSQESLSQGFLRFLAKMSPIMAFETKDRNNRTYFHQYREDRTFIQFILSEIVPEDTKAALFILCKYVEQEHEINFEELFEICCDLLKNVPPSFITAIPKSLVLGLLKEAPPLFWQELTPIKLSLFNRIFRFCDLGDIKEVWLTLNKNPDIEQPSIFSLSPDLLIKLLFNFVDKGLEPSECLSSLEKHTRDGAYSLLVFNEIRADLTSRYRERIVNEQVSEEEWAHGNYSSEELASSPVLSDELSEETKIEQVDCGNKPKNLLSCKETDLTSEEKVITIDSDTLRNILCQYEKVRNKGFWYRFDFDGSTTVANLRKLLQQSKPIALEEARRAIHRQYVDYTENPHKTGTDKILTELSNKFSESLVNYQSHVTTVTKCN